MFGCSGFPNQSKTCIANSGNVYSDELYFSFLNVKLWDFLMLVENEHSRLHHQLFRLNICPAYSIMFGSWLNKLPILDIVNDHLPLSKFLGWDTKCTYRCRLSIFQRFCIQYHWQVWMFQKIEAKGPPSTQTQTCYWYLQKSTKTFIYDHLGTEIIKKTSSSCVSFHGNLI